MTAIGEAARIDDQSQQSVIAAAKALLQVIDNAPIRLVAVACGVSFYERYAELIDAISRVEASK
jgi:hypothetical protein